MSGGFGDIKIRNLGEYVVKNFSMQQMGAAISRGVRSYRAKYITCRKAGMAPYFHMLGVCIVLNYMIEYKHLRAHESIRKYH
jgi:hypothetical protein